MIKSSVLRQFAKRHQLITIPTDTKPSDYWPSQKSLFINTNCFDKIAVHGMYRSIELFAANRAMTIDRQKTIWTLCSSSRLHNSLTVITPFILIPSSYAKQLEQMIMHVHRGWMQHIYGSNQWHMYALQQTSHMLEIAQKLTQQPLSCGIEVDSDGYYTTFINYESNPAETELLAQALYSSLT